MHAELSERLKAPDMPRRLRLHGYQWIGLPLLFLIPVLALFGVFGETQEHAQTSGETLALEVRYADRVRHKQPNTVEVRVENRTGRRLDTVKVALDEAYVQPFSVLAFIPSATKPFEVELHGLGPGERRLVVAELQAERYGRHAGALRAFAAGHPDTATVTLSTIVFP